MTDTMDGEVLRFEHGGCRVQDIAYTAFMMAKQPNDEDGGPSDWFNDTWPTIKVLIAAQPSASLTHTTAGEFEAMLETAYEDHQKGAAAPGDSLFSFMAKRLRAHLAAQPSAGAQGEAVAWRYKYHGDTEPSWGLSDDVSDLNPERYEIQALGVIATPAQPDTGAVEAWREAGELEADMERDLTESDHEAIERGLRTIRAFDAVRNLRSVLSDTMARQHNGYDWNADPDGMTIRQSYAVKEADAIRAALSTANTQGGAS